MAIVTHDSRYSRAVLKQDENGTKYTDWFGDIKIDINKFDDNFQYQVKARDTVFTIASEHYGSQRYYWAVCRANIVMNPFKKLVEGSYLTLVSDETFRTKILGVDNE